MFEKVLTPKTLGVIKRIRQASLPAGTYLGGGTAVALRFGHRRSQDLDFFAPSRFIESQWQQKLEDDLDFKLMSKDWQTLIGTINSVKFSLLGYKYSLLKPPEKFHDILVASLEDLSAMKLDAVTTRGTKRDFIDIYFLAQKFGLIKLLEFYQRKYKNFEDKQILVKKALIYFADADKDENPDLLVPVDWGVIKNWFFKEVYQL